MLMVRCKIERRTGLAGTIAGIPALPAHITDRDEEQAGAVAGAGGPATDRPPIAPRGAARDLIGMIDYVPPATNRWLAGMPPLQKAGLSTPGHCARERDGLPRNTCTAVCCGVSGYVPEPGPTPTGKSRA